MKENRLQIVEINEDNFYKIIKLNIGESQKKFVAPNVQSLAESYLYRNANDVFPYSIEFGDEVVGFLLTDLDYDEGVFMIWRIMIGEEYQNNGYGKKALNLIVEKAKNEGFKTLRADYVMGNDIMKKILEDFGFEKKGEDKKYNEIIMSYKL